MPVHKEDRAITLVRQSKIPRLSKNAITVLEKRYLQRDSKGNVTETPSDMFRRVADVIASADTKFDSNAGPTVLAEQFLP